MHAFYERLGLSVWATPSDVLRAGRRKLNRDGRLARRLRQERREFYSRLLECHRSAQSLYRAVAGGLL